MFGYAAFAQPPFAALGSTQFVLSITETINAMNDTNAEIDVFYEGVVEGMTSLDTPTINAQFLESITEIISALLDSELALTQFVEIVIEPLSAVADGQNQSYWIKINNGETASWVAIQNTESAGWTLINDSQSTNWTKINNTQ